jgi:tRNA-dihydrouridine synthase B
VLSNIKLIQKKVIYDEVERPVAFQVYDDDPVNILDASLRLMQYKPDILDVNLGCSVKAVATRGAGAGLLKNPESVRKTFELLTRNIHIPVTAKIRLGWDDESLNYLEIARIIEGSGGKAIAVHGRTRMQNYTHPARWDAIRYVKETVKIPVIGNGDIKTVADIDRMIAETGCDAVMIGRAAVGNPWILKRQEKSTVSRSEVVEVTLKHLGKSVEFYGELNGVRKFRKFLKRYLEGLDIAPYRMPELLSEEDPEILIAVLQNL